MVQWLGLCALTAEVLGSIPGQGTKIPQAMQHDQKKKKKCMKFTLNSINEKMFKLYKTHFTKLPTNMQPTNWEVGGSKT